MYDLSVYTLNFSRSLFIFVSASRLGVAIGNICSEAARSLQQFELHGLFTRWVISLRLEKALEKSNYN